MEIPKSCPHCGSDQIQRVAAIYEAGTSAINTETLGMGVGYSQGGFVPALGSASTEGVQQSELVSRLAPPGYEPALKMIIVMPVVLSVLWGLLVIAVAFVLDLIGIDSAGSAIKPLWILGSLGLAALSIRAGLRMARYNRENWPQDMESWRAEWYCHKCGERFSPGENAASDALGAS